MINKLRRQFTLEQKTEAVQMVLQSGKPISQIPKEMGLTESALRTAPGTNKLKSTKPQHPMVL